MAKQLGILPLSGSIDNLRFFQGRKGKYHVGKKSTLVDKNRILTDENYERTREIMSEFKTVAKAASLIRNGGLDLIEPVSTGDMNLRLRSLLFKVLRTDTSHPRGERTVMDGDLSWLSDFEFSGNGVVKNSYNGQYEASVHRIEGIGKVIIPAFTPKLKVKAPISATHFQFNLGVLELNFDTGTVKFSQASTEKLTWNDQEVTSHELEGAFTQNSMNPVLVLFGIEFWNETSGRWYKIKDQAYNGLLIAVTSQV